MTQLADGRLEWVAEIAGLRRQWVAKVLEQVPDQKVAWTAVEGATNAGEVRFDEGGPEQTESHRRASGAWRGSSSEGATTGAGRGGCGVVVR